MFYFDPLYFVFALPALLLGLYAQMKVRGAVGRFSQVGTARGVSGAQVARYLLDSEGLRNVDVEETQGFLSDHYDPRAKVLRLSPDVYRGTSLAAAGIAAHEMGHALQDAQGYAPLALRSAMVPTVQFGSWLGPLIFFGGFLMNMTGLAWLGLILFGATAAFALVTLPVEFDASRRAKRLLVERGILVPQEMQGVNSVLDAAALTYVAGAAQAISSLLYYAFLLMGRNDD
ncbi:MAG TPA: zinc metallopeptidase [Ardenticatenaceae bacterium]|nr:zinc metallopeptidase [Ardenticatenaceae bacterium]